MDRRTRTRTRRLWGSIVDDGGAGVRAMVRRLEEKAQLTLLKSSECRRGGSADSSYSSGYFGGS